MTQNQRHPRRRRFLKTAAGAAAASAGAAAGALAGCGRARGPWRFFTAQEARTVEAMAERLIPTDQDPGAAWAGVARYIDRQLAGRFTFRAFRELYRQGLAGVDQASAAWYRASFTELSAEQQVAVLRALEKGQAPGAAWKQVAPRQFFDAVLNHTMQGYYGDPRHGGNRDGVGWRALGLPPGLVRGREQHDLRLAPRPAGGSS